MYGRHLRRAIGSTPATWVVTDSSCASTRHFHISVVCAQDGSDSSSRADFPSRGTSRRSAAAAASKEIQNLASNAIDLRNLSQSGTERRPLVRRVGRDGPSSHLQQQLTRRPAQRRSDESGNAQAQDGYRTPLDYNGTRAPLRSSRGGFASRGGRTPNARGSRRGGSQLRGRGGAGTRGSSRRRGEGEEPRRAGLRASEEDIADSEIFPSDIENEEEAVAYAELRYGLERLESMELNVQELLQKGSEKDKLEAAQIRGDIQSSLAFYLDQLANVKQKWTKPQHEPQELYREHAVGAIGDVPIGLGGMGRVVEEGLRLMVRRQGMEWQDPKELAGILASGNVMKFRHIVERDDVVRLAKYMIPGAESPAAEEDVFVPLDEASKKVIVQRLVKGEYVDKGDEALKDKVLQTVARITNGNYTYLSMEKSKLLEKIQSVLPAQQTSRRASKRTQI